VRVFVCSPLRGDVAANLAFAAQLCRQVAIEGHSPCAPHVFCPQFLSDDDELERATGIQIGLDFLSVCHELWWHPKDGEGPTHGMRAEIQAAECIGLPVRRWPL